MPAAKKMEFNVDIQSISGANQKLKMQKNKLDVKVHFSKEFLAKIQ